MLRIYMLQNLYDLSDMGTVAEVIDSRAFSEFCGVDSSNQVPDGDTLGRFRHILEENGIQQKLFAQVVQHLMKMVPKLLTGEETTVYGDSGYLGAEKRDDAITRNAKGKRSNTRSTSDRPRARKSLPVLKHISSVANTKSHLSGQR